MDGQYVANIGIDLHRCVEKWIQYYGIIYSFRTHGITDVTI